MKYLHAIIMPQKNGRMFFVRPPDNISIEILQENSLDTKKPWLLIKIFVVSN